MPVKRIWLEAGATVIALGIAAILGFLLLRSHDFALRNGQPVFGDYIAFWSAGRAVLDGEAEHVHERPTQFGYHKEAVPDVRFYAQFNSPPTFLLITPVMALAPFPVSALLFLALTGALYVFTASKLLPDKRALLFALTAPAAVYHLGSVQVGLLIAAVSGLALHWLDRRPRAAGALIGVLAIKPHLAILWPLLLALSGRWRAFFAAALATTGFVLAAGLAFGFDAYLRFFENLSASASLIAEQRVSTPAYASLYANLLQLHAPQGLALPAHALSAVAGLGAAFVVFRHGERATQGAALCAATLLISPYLFFYDFLLLAAGAALLGPPRDRLELAAAILAWGAGLSLTLGYFVFPFPLCPLAAWLVLIAALKRAGSAGSLLAPAPPK